MLAVDNYHTSSSYRLLCNKHRREKNRKLLRMFERAARYTIIYIYLTQPNQSAIIRVYLTKEITLKRQKKNSPPQQSETDRNRDKYNGFH
jgi:hypothetical protein